MEEPQVSLESTGLEPAFSNQSNIETSQVSDTEFLSMKVDESSTGNTEDVNNGGGNDPQDKRKHSDSDTGGECLKKIKSEHDYDGSETTAQSEEQSTNPPTAESLCKYFEDWFEIVGNRLLERIYERYFLRTDGKLIDFYTVRKKSPFQINASDIHCWLNEQSCFNRQSVIDSLDSYLVSKNIIAPAIGRHPSSVHTPLSAAVNSAPILATTDIKQEKSSFESIAKTSTITSPSVTYVNSSLSSTATTVTSAQSDKSALVKKHPLSASLEESSRIGSREQIVERAKQEAFVIKRIAELRQSGLWSIKRLPKVQEPQRNKTHWDYLLEEMQWLAVDFFQERKWKKNSAKRCSKMIVRYHALKECQAERSEKEQQMKLKKIASNIAKHIRNFWSEIEKVVEAKQEVQLNEKRKKIQDMQLRFIVDKADHFTEKLAQEWVGPALKNSRAPSVDSEAESEPKGPESKNADDEEFEQGSACSDDDEETIAKEEAQDEKVDYTDEINHLSAESEMPIEKLLEMYGIKSEDMETNETQDTMETEDTEDSRTNDSDLRDSDLENIVSEDKKEENETAEQSANEITDIAAGAESLQPKGNTLSSVEVITKVPFLLKYTLREYQHIGLDWLVAMYEKNLNGILADEMGLGKTIQTIALIAHLACEKEIWGPHLIVVPTSVMLNWEMEFKKWCPALKLLTYYGSPKERKLKRKGWTKPNTFHVCITSYKLVVQDNQSFRRQKWVYLILDEAQHIKNFKSQRWQMLLNFHSSRRLLLTGTPLQNDLMELWSLMHFLMPNVFQSHQEFKDLFVNPVTGMIEGNNEYNETLVRRLHKVLRPFLLRRLKCDVEKQLPKKYEHVIRCSLSKRQRFLYDEFMSLGKTKETLASGNFLSVINILMQLRKVCNHPNLFDPRPTVSPFIDNAIYYYIPSLFTSIFDYKPLSHVNFDSLNLTLTKPSKYDMHDQRRINTAYYTAEGMHRVATSEPISYVRLTDYKDFIRMLNNTKFFNNNNSAKLLTNTSVKVVASPQVISKSFGNKNSLLQNSIKLQKNQDSNCLKLNIQQVTRKMICVPNIDSSKNAASDGEKPKIEIVKKEDSENEPPKDGVLGVGQYAIPKTVEKINDIRAEKINRLAVINRQRCQSYSLMTFYNRDVLKIGNNAIDSDIFNFEEQHSCHSVYALGNGQTYCLQAQSRMTDWNSTDLCDYTEALNSLVFTPEKLECYLRESLERFLCIVPAVIAPPVKVVISHQDSYKKMDKSSFVSSVEKQLPAKFFNVLAVPQIQQCFQLPELRLIQYDCGKLQVLDKLLWQLKYEKHRVLIFTQMSRMLDIFEQFLNYHGHTYLRLDGSTKIDQRQALMERFNADQRIFCFILSTRSGGVGVNLTGADTVIFYDSDWNPTMDAQAQDRCHRIGQTRDVHIYRLISERTIEENILKKARQKKLLGDLAIEEGNFTTAFFKQNAIKELFDVENQFGSEEQETTTVVSEPVANEPTTSNPVSNAAFEQALGTAEEDNDVAAAKIVRAEAAAEFDEFDENIPLEDIPDEKSPEEEQIEEVISQLLPVERYALNFVESFQNFNLLKQAEEEIEETKKQCQKNMDEWKRKNEEQQRQMLEEYRESILTCSREDSSLKKVFLSINGLEPMPIWAPPTPPQDDNDLYIDQTLGFLYERTIMHESQLPPVYMPKEHKRLRLDPSNLNVRKYPPGATPAIKSGRRNDDLYTIPKSPFDRASSSISRLRRELLITKLKLWPGSSNFICSIHRTFSAMNATTLPPSNISSQQILAKSHQNFNSNLYPRWLVQEEFSIVLVLVYFQDLPFNLSVVFPGHVPNWDFVSEEVNSHSCVKRSSNFCKYHFESLLVAKDDPRFDADGNAGAPPNTKQPKSKKLKNQAQNPYSPLPVTPNTPIPPSMPAPSPLTAKGQANATNSSQPLHRVSNIVQSMITDNNVEFTNEMNRRFDAIKQIVIQKTQTSKSRFRTHPKLFDHVNLLKADYKINYEQPINAEEIASMRTSRITRDKHAKEQKHAREQQQQQQQSAAQLEQTLQKQQIFKTLTAARQSGNAAAVASAVQAMQATSQTTHQASNQVIINQQQAAQNTTFRQLVYSKPGSTVKLQTLPSDGSTAATSIEQPKINTSNVINLQSSSPNVHHVTLSQAQSLGLIGQGVTSISSLQPQTPDSVQLQQQIQQTNLATQQPSGQFVVQSSQTGQQIPVNVSINQSQFPQKLYAIAAPGTSAQAGTSTPQGAQVNLSGQLISPAVARANPQQVKQILLRQHQIRQQLANQQLQQQSANIQISAPQRAIHSQAIRAQGLSQGSTPNQPQRFQITSLSNQAGHSVLPSLMKQIVATSMVTTANTTTSQTLNTTMVGSQRILTSSNSGHMIPTSVVGSLITTSKGTVVASGNASIIARTIRADNFTLANHLKQQQSGNSQLTASPNASLGQQSQIFVQQTSSQANTDPNQQSTPVPVSFVKSITPGVSGANVSAIQISSTTASLLSNSSNTFTIPITSTLASNAKLIAQSISGGNVTVVPSSIPTSGTQFRQIHLLQKRAQPSIQVSSTSMSPQVLTHKTIVQQSGAPGTAVVSSDSSARSSPNIISPLLQSSSSIALNKTSNTFHLVPASAVQQLQSGGGPITVTSKALFASGSPTVTVQQMNQALKQGNIIMQQQQPGSGQHQATMSATSSSTQPSANFILANQQQQQQSTQISPIKTSSGHYITVSSNDSSTPTTIKLLPTSTGTIAIQQGQQGTSGSVPQSISTPKGHIIISGHAAASLIGQSGIVTSTSANAIASSALLQQVVSGQSSSGSNSGQTLTFAIRTAHGQPLSHTQQQPVHLSTLTLKAPASSAVQPTSTTTSVSQNSALVAALSSTPENQSSANPTLLRTLATSNVSTKAIPIVLMQSSHNSNFLSQTSGGTPVSLIGINSNSSTSTTSIRTAIPSNKITTATQTSGATLGSILSAAAKAASSAGTSTETYTSGPQSATASKSDTTLIEALIGQKTSTNTIKSKTDSNKPDTEQQP